MTITEIAKVAGVSIATVSRYLNNGPVKEETRKQLESVILELNYVPESMVHQIVNTPTTSLAVLTHSLSNNYTTEFTETLRQKYIEQGKLLYICCINEPTIEYKYLMDLVSRGIKGVILHDLAYSDKQIEIFNKLGKYLSMVLIHSFTTEFPFNTISVTQETGMRNAMKYLLGLGHRKILFIRGAAGYSFDIKERIWRDELQKEGMQPAKEDILTVYGGNWEGGMETTYKAVIKYLNEGNRPTAIFTCNDIMAMGTLKALREKGISIPGDISLMSHDNTALAECNSLTSVDMKIHSVALAAMDLLEYAMNGSDTTPRHISITPELVIRSSCLPLSETHI